MFADIVFIVELGDFLFTIKFEALIFVPIISCKFFEKIPLLLTFLWSWVLNSLTKIKWKGQELLSVGRLKLLFTAKLIDILLVRIELLVKGLDDHVKVSWWKWLLRVVDLVDKSL